MNGCRRAIARLDCATRFTVQEITDGDGSQSREQGLGVAVEVPVNPRGGTPPIVFMAPARGPDSAATTCRRCGDLCSTALRKCRADIDSVSAWTVSIRRRLWPLS